MPKDTLLRKEKSFLRELHRKLLDGFSEQINESDFLSRPEKRNITNAFRKLLGTLGESELNDLSLYLFGKYGNGTKEIEELFIAELEKFRESGRKLSGNTAMEIVLGILSILKERQLAAQSLLSKEKEQERQLGVVKRKIESLEAEEGSPSKPPSIYPPEKTVPSTKAPKPFKRVSSVREARHIVEGMFGEEALKKLGFERLPFALEKRKKKK